MDGLSLLSKVCYSPAAFDTEDIKFVHVNTLEPNQDISLNSETGSISANAPFRAAVARCCALSCVNDPSDNPRNPQKSLKTNTASSVII